MLSKETASPQHSVHSGYSQDSAQPVVLNENQESCVSFTSSAVIAINDDTKEMLPSRIKPPSFLLLGVLSLVFCCLPFSIVSLYNATQVNSACQCGDYRQAQTYSKRAGKWGLGGVFTGSAIIVLFVVVFVLIL